MHTKLLYENEQKRREIPLWMLLCFVMFCVWQMGIIYYIGPALNIDGRTPLPISPDNLTLLIVAGYVCSILTMIFFPKTVILFSRLSTVTALLSAIGLFLPLGRGPLTLLIYIQCFCCCYMIDFESATMVHYFSGSSVIRHLLIAYPIGYTMIAFIQSDFITMDFSVFRILMTVMLILLLSFLSALLGVIAPAAAAEVNHGVFAAYMGCAVSSGLVYLLYKKQAIIQLISSPTSLDCRT